MTILLLIRHGQNDLVGKKLAGRLPNVHLNETGQAQARRLAAELAVVPIKAVFASPLARAIETAEPIARIQNLSVESFPDLIEIDFGSWQGKSIKQLKRRVLWKAVQSHPSGVRFPQGESFTDAQVRVVEGLRSISKKYQDRDRVVCVAHCDVIRLAVAHFLGMPLDNFQRIHIAPASITFLYLNGNAMSFGPINHTLDLANSAG